MLSSKSRRSSNRAATVLRLAALNVGKTQTAWGAFYDYDSDSHLLLAGQFQPALVEDKCVFEGVSKPLWPVRARYSNSIRNDSSGQSAAQAWKVVLVRRALDVIEEGGALSSCTVSIRHYCLVEPLIGEASFLVFSILSSSFFQRLMHPGSSDLWRSTSSGELPSSEAIRTKSNFAC